MARSEFLPPCRDLSVSMNFSCYTTLFSCKSSPQVMGDIADVMSNGRAADSAHYCELGAMPGSLGSYAFSIVRLVFPHHEQVSPLSLSLLMLVIIRRGNGMYNIILSRCKHVQAPVGTAVIHCCNAGLREGHRGVKSCFRGYTTEFMRTIVGVIVAYNPPVQAL